MPKPYLPTWHAWWPPPSLLPTWNTKEGRARAPAMVIDRSKLSRSEFRGTNSGSRTQKLWPRCSAIPLLVTVATKEIRTLCTLCCVSLAIGLFLEICLTRGTGSASVWSLLIAFVAAPRWPLVIKRCYSTFQAQEVAATASIIPLLAMATSVEQQQQRERPPQVGGAEADAREKRAVKKEELVVLTSGAKEKRDKTIAGMKGAAHVMTHPFSKAAREEASAKTVEEKNKVGYKQASIRMAAHQQVVQEKGGLVGAQQQPGDDAGSPGMVDSPMADVHSEKPAEQTEEGSPSSSSSDGSARARSQIPPDSEEYRSG